MRESKTLPDLKNNGDLWFSGCKRLKQMLNKFPDDEWMKGFSSTKLHFPLITSCHGNAQWNSGSFLAYSDEMRLATTSKMMVNDETKLKNTGSLKILEKKFKWRVRVFERKMSFDLFLWKWLGLLSRKCSIYTLFSVCKLG